MYASKLFATVLSTRSRRQELTSQNLNLALGYDELDGIPLDKI